MRKADRKRQSERRKLEKHRQRYIRKEKKLAKKLQKQQKKGITGWKKSKRTKKINLFSWFSFTKILGKPSGKPSLKSRNWSLVNWIYKKRDQYKLKREKRKLKQETGSISSKVGPSKISIFAKRLGKLFSKSIIFNKISRK